MYLPQHPFNHGVGGHMPPSNPLLDPNLNMATSPLYQHHQQLLAAQESIRQSQMEATRIRDIINSHRQRDALGQAAVNKAAAAAGGRNGVGSNMRYSPDGRALGKKTTKRPPQPETYFEGWGVNDDVGRR